MGSGSAIWVYLERLQATSRCFMPHTPSDDPSDDLLGGRVRLRELVDNGSIGYRDPRGAARYLDRIGVPYVVVRRERQYRPTDILRAVNRSEVQALSAA